MLAPGGLLLQQAIKRRSQMSHHLTRLMLENNMLPAATDPDLGQDSPDHASPSNLPADQDSAGTEHLHAHADNRLGGAHFDFDDSHSGQHHNFSPGSLPGE